MVPLAWVQVLRLSLGELTNCSCAWLICLSLIDPSWLLARLLPKETSVLRV